MPQFSEKQKAQQAVDDLHVSFINRDAVSTEQLVTDVEQLAALVVTLAGEIDYLRMQVRPVRTFTGGGGPHG